MIFAKMQNDIEAVLGYIAQSVCWRVRFQLVLQAQALGMTIVGIDHSCVEQLPESMFTTPDDVVDATMRQRERLFIETLTGLEAVNGKRAIMLMGYGHNAIFQPKTGLGRITELVFLYSRDLKG